MTRLIPLFVLAPLAGCIIYEKDVVHHGPHDGCYDCGWADSGDSGAPVEDPETAWWLDPAEIAAGDTLILSLQSDPMSDYTAISSLEFYGDVVVCTTQARTEELLVTVSAAETAAPGPVDLVIEFSDGTATWVDDALNVLGANADQPDGSGDGSGDAGGSGGSGDAGGSGGSDGDAGGSGGSDDGTVGCG